MFGLVHVRKGLSILEIWRYQVVGDAGSYYLLATLRNDSDAYLRQIFVRYSELALDPIVGVRFSYHGVSSERCYAAQYSR